MYECLLAAILLLVPDAGAVPATQADGSLSGPPAGEAVRPLPALHVPLPPDPPGPATPAASVLPAADSPLGAVWRLLASYERREFLAYTRLMTLDYRFVFADSALRARHSEGLTREDEIGSTALLARGYTDPEGVVHAPVAAIEIGVDSIWVAPDTSSAGPVAHRAVVVARALSLYAVLADGDSLTAGPMSHEFVVVRGDEAACPPGEPADSLHWYVRSWIERSEAEVSALLGGAPEDAPAARTAAAVPLSLAILPHANPARWPFDLALALPATATARLDLIDVTGRIALRHGMGDLGPGVHRVRLEGALAPGVYWARLVAGPRSVTSRVVVIP